MPRLALQAALNSVRLRKLIVEEHDLLIDSVKHWTVPITVLQWLHSADRRQNINVANRTAENLKASTLDEWKHIKGQLNPSDIGTRGITIEKLSESDWLCGQLCLKDQPELWTISSAPGSSVIEDHTQVAGIANKSMVGDSPFDWNRFSSFSKRVVAIAYCLRLKYKGQSKVLPSDELQRAEERALKLFQIETFSEFCNGKQYVKNTKKGGNLANFCHFPMKKGLSELEVVSSMPT